MASVSASLSRPCANIVGAGVIGMLSALALHRRGWQVRLFDRGIAGRQSSWAGGGVLSPILPWNYPAPIWQLSRRSLQLYPAIADELIQATGVDPELTVSGAYVLDAPGREAGLSWSAGAGLPAQLQALDLGAGREPRTGLALPWIGHIRNPRLCRALALQLTRLGIEIHENRPVLQWMRRDGRVVGVRTEQADFEADVGVLAAGAWSAQLTPLPVMPVRGQMLLLRAEPGRLPGIIMDGGRYLIPRRDGRILVGSTVEHVGFDVSQTDDARIQLQGFAASLIGDVADQIEAHWSGLRPGSVDELPLIGAHPHLPGLFLNTGHYRNGLVMAPASAELLADLIESTTPQVEASAYAPTAERLLHSP